mmetsp:Transcript_3897/g.8173  ORF Transcript_3897/g.8173 Transcript_3897/m.8173 type:complete len:99 (+) Transcript_3897:146-442(+)|eukprot:CAMPEP_0204900822 /NCGR_PEP_ID=MMETSP1397-20131031/2706_1 /ASSEMBLY_ACC=CAM_ASM_000891 /TAXON_ID=49980 /ORGANISM="Climacostomum Climacostomum virens, Strain Stock W-24" /LENGTH=98 /DNA_ID=CAMNT_0052069047 /DNA_START=101 /DNA_END=397 /DNA_ORIENTATION=-
MESETNLTNIRCSHCNCLILRPNLGHKRFVEVVLPGDAQFNEFWMIEDIYSFDNIAVTHQFEDKKLLTCAECEKGILGYIQLPANVSYLAVEQVSYEE